MFSEANPGSGITIALLLLMKMNLVSARKVALLVAAVCTVMLASVSQVRAERHPLPPQGVRVPSGATGDVAGCCPWRAWNGSAFYAEALVAAARAARLNQETGQAFLACPVSCLEEKCRATGYGGRPTPAQTAKRREFVRFSFRVVSHTTLGVYPTLHLNELS